MLINHLINPLLCNPNLRGSYDSMVSLLELSYSTASNNISTDSILHSNELNKVKAEEVSSCKDQNLWKHAYI